MSKEKQIQIPEPLFLDMCRYFLLDQAEPELASRISKGISDKFERIACHDFYTTYKTAPSEQEKERARKEYLERKGIPTNFRW